MLLSEHVYCVAVTFKMTEWVGQWICMKFCIKLEHFSTETVQVIQKASAMGSWWLAASSGEWACSCITSHAEFLAKYQITQVNQPHYSQDLAPCDFWLFPKLKSPLKGNRIQNISEIQEDTMEQLMVIGGTMWGPKVLLWRGLRHHCLMYNVSSNLYLLQ